MSDYVQFSDEQMVARAKILKHYESIRYVLMTAEMQSGKSMAYHLVAGEMVRLGKSKKIIIMSGNQETELRDQVINKNRREFSRFYRKYLRDEVHLSADEADTITDNILDKIEVLWGASLMKFRGQVKDAFVVWDESHYAQTKGMRPDKFLKAVGISADGDIGVLESKNNYVLSVSATPFSEFSDLVHLKQKKARVHLFPGQGYIGVKYMRDNGLIVGVSDEWQTDLRNELAQYTGSAKYALIRAAGNCSKDIRMIAAEYGWDIKTYDSSAETMIHEMDELETEPTNNTVVILKGKCRMGKTVPKTHVAFVMETSKIPNTDTVLQGLLGRMCGYTNPGNIRVLLSAKVVEGGELDRFIRWTSSQDIRIIPQIASNLSAPTNEYQRMNTAIQNGDQVHPIIPIKIHISNVDISDESIHRQIRDGNMEDYNDAAQQQEIRTRMDAICKKETNEELKITFIRKNGDAVEPRTYGEVPQKIYELFSTKTPGKLGSSCGIAASGEGINAWGFLADFPTLGIKKGDVFIDARTKAFNMKQYADVINRSAISTTTKKEVFCRTLETGEEVENNGGYTMSLLERTHNDIEFMENSINELIQISLQPSEFIFKPRSITSNYTPNSGHPNWQGIAITEEVFNALKTGRIFKKMQEKYGVNLKVEKSRGPIPKALKERGLLRLKFISW